MIFTKRQKTVRTANPPVLYSSIAIAMDWELEKTIKNSRMEKKIPQNSQPRSHGLSKMVDRLILGTKLPDLNQQTVSGDSKKCGNN